MKITVQYFTIVRNVTGKKEEAVEVHVEATVAGILKDLINKYGTAFQRIVQSGSNFPGLKILFLVNGQNIETIEGLNTKLNNGDNLAIIPPLSGG